MFPQIHIYHGNGNIHSFTMFPPKIKKDLIEPKKIWDGYTWCDNENYNERS